MQNITIGRYKRFELTGSEQAALGGGTFRDVADDYDGWIEGTRDDGSNWIMWLDAQGSPGYFWAQRDPDGGVIGDPVRLG